MEERKESTKELNMSPKSVNVTIDGVKSVIDASLGNRNPFWVRKLKIRLMNAAQVPIYMI